MIIDFIKKALFGKTLSALNEREKSLSEFESYLLEKQLNQQKEAKNLSFKEQLLEEGNLLLQDKKNVLKALKLDLLKRQSEIESKERELNISFESFEELKMSFDVFVNEQEEIINTKFKDLAEYENELQDRKEFLDAYYEDIESKKVESETIKARNEEIADYKVVMVRGKEALIDKYGNFKQFT
jgi:DNA repair exonuclease SbcCD ATPase subunit